MKKPDLPVATLLLVRPARFGFNRQTAVNNPFQHPVTEGSDVQGIALKEFDGLVRALRHKDIPTLVLQDTPDPVTPDSIFPNNWVSSHEDHTLVVYPMFAPNRRQERKGPVLASLREALGSVRVIDLTGWEERGLFLEGTGSMVLDRPSKTAYACLSPRTSTAVLEDFCRRTGYRAVPFEAVDKEGRPIYHTNLMMSVGHSFAVLCRDSFVSGERLEQVEESLSERGKTVVDISFAQMDRYCGNILEVRNRQGEKYILMSETARSAFREDQLEAICQEAEPLSAPVPCIESVGGGSVRCMVAELFPGKL